MEAALKKQDVLRKLYCQEIDNKEEVTKRIKELPAKERVRAVALNF